MIKMLQIGAILFCLYSPLHLSAQIYIEKPGPYVNCYSVNSSSGSLSGDTTYWEHRTYTNGILSLSEFRDTTWAGANLTQKIVYYGSPGELDSVQYIQVTGTSENLTSVTIYEYESAYKYIQRVYGVLNGVREENNRYTFFLDNQGRVIEDRTMSVDWQSGQLEQLFKRVRTYTAAGQEETILAYTYDNGYELTDKHWFEYNASGQRITEYTSYFENGTEVLDQRYDYVYDAAGYLHHVSHYIYDSSTSAELSRYYELEHNEDGLITFEREYDVIGPDTATEWFIGHERFWAFEGGLLVSAQFDMMGSSGAIRLIDSRYTYASEEFPTQVEPIKGSSDLAIKVFPNPCSDQLRLSSEKNIAGVVVSTIQGKQVLAMTTFPSLEASIPTGSLAAGTYVVQVTLEDGSGLRSIFVKR